MRSFFVLFCNSVDTGNILFNDAMNGARLTASAAIRTFFVVDRCEVIYECDRAVGTSLCALAATDATVGAELANHRALIVAGAENESSVDVGHKLDDVMGASLRADAAADAELAVYECNTVFDADGILGASPCAVTETDTTEGASA